MSRLPKDQLQQRNSNLQCTRTQRIPMQIQTKIFWGVTYQGERTSKQRILVVTRHR